MKRSPSDGWPRSEPTDEHLSVRGTLGVLWSTGVSGKLKKRDILLHYYECVLTYCMSLYHLLISLCIKLFSTYVHCLLCSKLKDTDYLVVTYENLSKHYGSYVNIKDFQHLKYENEHCAS